MDKERLLKLLAEFFMDSLQEDPAGVGDWAIQGDAGESVDDIVAAIDQFAAKSS
jgi:hypothetical protein